MKKYTVDVNLSSLNRIIDRVPPLRNPSSAKMVSAIWTPLTLILVLTYSHYASANSEGDILQAFKSNLVDPYGVMNSWNASMINPCTWFHVTCNSDNSVTRIDLGAASLSGQLVPELGQLSNLQYLELYNNNISGKIPCELGNLKHLVSLDLYLNNLAGHIPDMGKLTSLRFLRLNHNKLSGQIPRSLTKISTLQILDLSYNQLSGTIPHNGSFAQFTPLSFAGNPKLKWPAKAAPRPSSPSSGPNE